MFEFEKEIARVSTKSQSNEFLQQTRGGPEPSDLTAVARMELWTMLWSDYCRRVPEAPKIEKALKSRGEIWKEDHVAFRCLPGTPLDATGLQRFFEALGYTKQDSYRFSEKKLNAFWMKPPVDQETKAWEAAPKVFISELDITAFDAENQRILLEAVGIVLPQLRKQPPLFSRKISPIDVSSYLAECKAALTLSQSDNVATALPFELYEKIRAFSEYAAWTLVFGVCINHFTVSAHLMKGFNRLDELNQYLKETVGVRLNQTGGSEIKGSPGVFLEQSATLAAPIEVTFAGVRHSIPYAFVEFAYRFQEDPSRSADKWSSYFQGFVEGNADRIFSSTDASNLAINKQA